MTKIILAFITFILFSIGFAATYIDGSVAKIQVMNKLTNKVEVLSIPVGSVARFDNIDLSIKTCKRTIPSEETENAVFLEVNLYKVKRDESNKNITNVNTKILNKERIFSGWMFSSTPGLSAMENAEYDVWLITCQQ